MLISVWPKYDPSKPSIHYEKPVDFSMNQSSLQLTNVRPVNLSMTKGSHQSTNVRPVNFSMTQASLQFSDLRHRI